MIRMEDKSKLADALKKAMEKQNKEMKESMQRRK